MRTPHRRWQLRLDPGQTKPSQSNPVTTLSGRLVVTGAALRIDNLVAGFALGDDVEDFKVWLAARPGVKGGGLSSNTHRQRLRTLRAFFERIIEWGWPDGPPRTR